MAVGVGPRPSAAVSSDNITDAGDQHCPKDRIAQKCNCRRAATLNG